MDSVLVQEENEAIVTPAMTFSPRVAVLLALLGGGLSLPAQEGAAPDPLSLGDLLDNKPAPAAPAAPPAAAQPDVGAATPPDPAAPATAAQPDAGAATPPAPTVEAPPADGNVVPNPGFDKRDAEGKPGAWSIRPISGSKQADIAGVVGEGRDQGPCLKLSYSAPTRSAFGAPIPLKPDTDYVFGGWVKTDGVVQGSGTTGAMVRIGCLANPGLKVSSDFLHGTQDWREVKGRMRTGSGADQGFFVLCLLGGDGETKGTAWFDGIYVREDKTPYRRPALDPPVFYREGLSLDKDQVSDLATALASVVCNFPEQGAVLKPDFKACVLGIALRLDPRNRIAVVANSQLDAGQTPKSSDAFTDFAAVVRLFDQLAPLLLGQDATTDDKALGLYLGDILWQLDPGSGFAPQYVKLHDSGRGADWVPILPPLPKPKDDGGKQGASVAEGGGKEGGAGGADESGTAAVTPGGEEYPVPIAKISVGPAFGRTSASCRTVILGGGPGTRAILRPVMLTWRDYRLEQRYSAKESRNVDVRVPLEPTGRADAVFGHTMGTTLSTVWTARILPDFRKRFSGWPTSGAVDVTIAGYSDVNGSSAALATAMAWESLMRDVEINPRVAVVATWTEKGALATHSHLPDMLIGYGRNWSDILLVGPGSSAKVADAAVRGYLLPLVSTQVIEVRNYAEAMDIATGKIEAKTKASIEGVAQVLALRSKMDAAAMMKNKFVIDRLNQLAAANPLNLTPSLLLAAAGNQKRLDAQQSAEEIGRLFQWLEQMAEADIEWIPEAEGIEAVEIFNDRLREIRPRMDASVNRLNIRIDESVKAITDMVHVRDRTTATAIRRAETTRETLAEARRAIDQAATSQP